MTRNPLIATPTVDKNGRVTTVHKRMDTGSTSPGRAIPKVALPAQPQDNCKLIIESGFETDIHSVKMSDNVRAKMMATLHPETLTRMENLLRNHNVPVTVFRRATFWCAQNRNFAVLNSLALLTEEADDKDKHTKIQERVMAALMGVQHIREPKTPEIDFTNPEESRTEGGRALVNALITRGWSEGLISYINPKKDQTAFVFIDYGVGNLIMDRPDRTDEIIDMYGVGRTPYDRGLYEARLDNNVRSLNSGAL